jgi:hypothetical protein
MYEYCREREREKLQYSFCLPDARTNINERTKKKKKEEKRRGANCRQAHLSNQPANLPPTTTTRVLNA